MEYTGVDFPIRTMKALDWTHLFKKYPGKWVALKSDDKTVVGSGSTLKRAKQAAKKKGFHDPSFTKIPKHDRYFIGFHGSIG